MKVGSIKDIRIQGVTKEKFSVWFDYDPKIDADHRIHLVAIDPAGNASEVKAINFASKPCYEYRNDPAKPDWTEGAITCGHHDENPPIPDGKQWCKPRMRSPWGSLPDIQDPLDKDRGNIYDHRKNDPKCRYYEIVEKNYDLQNSVPGVITKWNQHGCQVSSCCPNQANPIRCPTQILCNNPDTNCYDGPCSLDIRPCTNYLNNTHFDKICKKPTPGSCKQTNPPPPCNCTPKTNAPPGC